MTSYPRPRPVVRQATRQAATARLPRRRLYQGCAILLLIPCAAAFLPFQQRAPQPVHALVPVDTTTVAAAAPAPLPQRVEAAATQIIRRVRRVTPSDPSAISGLASWYGNVLRGHRTASGEIFNPDELTACSRTLPFGTLVRVVNLLNHRSVTVRITDRGVLSANRVIDLSSAAAEQIDMLHSGIAPVRLEVQKMADRKLVPPAATQGDAESDGGF